MMVFLKASFNVSSCLRVSSVRRALYLYAILSYHRVLRATAPSRAMSRKAAALFNPTEEHAQLRTLAASFAKNTIGPQAAEFDKKVCIYTSG